MRGECAHPFECKEDIGGYHWYSHLLPIEEMLCVRVERRRASVDPGCVNSIPAGVLCRHRMGSCGHASRRRMMRLASNDGTNSSTGRWALKQLSSPPFSVSHAWTQPFLSATRRHISHGRGGMAVWGGMYTSPQTRKLYWIGYGHG